MRIVYDPAELAVGSPERLVATVGNFDGVHRGHELVLSELLAGASSRGALSLAVTFEPHPDRVLAARHARPLLTPLPEKAELIGRSRIDALLVASFTNAMARLGAREFLAWLGVGRGSHLVVGYDFRMGTGRACDAAGLASLGAEIGYGLDVVPPVEFDGQPISSSRIREAVSSGDVRRAAAMLGRPYVLRGRVSAGQGMGRRLGVPTANLTLPGEKLLPADGVYFATVETLDGRPGLLYVGTRPTLGGGERRAEVHVLDLSADLMGGDLAVAVREHLRGDVRFQSLERLRKEIERDIAWVRGKAGAGCGPECGGATRLAFSF